MTSFAVLVMVNWDYPESDPIVANGIAYLRSDIHPDGSVYSNLNRSTYYTSIAILPLVATHNPLYHDEISRMRQWLIDLQWDEGSVYGENSIPPSPTMEDAAMETVRDQIYPTPSGRYGFEVVRCRTGPGCQ